MLLSLPMHLQEVLLSLGNDQVLVALSTSIASQHTADAPQLGVHSSTVRLMEEIRKLGRVPKQVANVHLQSA